MTLEEAMESRALALGMTWAELSRRSGVSEETIAVMRSGDGTHRKGTERRIEQALRWAPGSIEAVRAGGRPREATSLDLVPGRGSLHVANDDDWRRTGSVDLGELTKEELIALRDLLRQRENAVTTEIVRRSDEGPG